MLYTLRYRDRIMKNVSIDVDPPTLEEATAVGQDYVSMVLANPNIVFVSVEPACVHSSAAMQARIATEAAARIRRDKDLQQQRRRPAASDDAADEGDETAQTGRPTAQAPRQRTTSSAPGPQAPAPPRPRVTPATPTSKDKRRTAPPPNRQAPRRQAAEVEDRGHHVDPGQNEPTLGVEDPRAHARNLVQRATQAGRVERVGQ